MAGLESTLRFADLAFDCHGCGRCCETDWDIPVERPTFPVERLPNGRALLRRVEGRCTELTPDCRCSLHGTESKPLACRLFPFQMVRTPDGVHVGASFYCPSVYHGRGRPLSAHAQTLEAYAQKLPALGDAPLRLNDHETIGWSGYRLLEEALASRLPHLWGAVRELGATTGRALEELTPSWIPGRPHPDDRLLRRYMGQLLERKYLLTGPGKSLRENLGLLALIPYLVEEPAQASIAVLERDFYTHAKGAAAWIPALRSWFDRKAPTRQDTV